MILHRRQPSKTQLYRLGLALSRELEPHCTLEQVAAEIGTTKQNAYHESVRALGKFAWRLQCQFSPADQGQTCA
jgi:hypothetical protein